MKTKDIMNRLVVSVRPDDKAADAAHLMREHDVGMLPVVADHRVAGVVTDRDLVVRGMNQGRGSDTPIASIMTNKVHCCYPDDSVDDALRIMADEQVRRLPVCDRSGALLGMISLADAARYANRRKEVALTLADICQPLGDHCQSVAHVA